MAATRRKFLIGGAAGLATWTLATVLGRTNKVQAQEAVSVAYPPLIVSRRVSQIPLNPWGSGWESAEPVRIPLAPQIIVKPRETSGETQDLLVRSIFDDERVGFLIEPLDGWGMKHTSVGRTDHHGDAVALQLTADITKPLPYFGMGEVNNEVIIYQWKSNWEFAPHHDVDEEFPGMVSDFYPYAGKGPGQIVEGADYGQEGQDWPADKVFNTGWAAGSSVSNPELKEKTSVQKMVAGGFGQSTADSNQDGLGKADWVNGWHVVITFPRKQDRYDMVPGVTYPLALAAWHGHHGNRGGQKHISTWSSFVMEQGITGSSIWLAVLTAAVLGAVEWVVFRRRKKATQKESK